MQRPCLSGTTRRVGFVDGKKFAAKTSNKIERTVVVLVGPPTKHNDSADALSLDNPSESFENTCMGPVSN